MFDTDRVVIIESDEESPRARVAFPVTAMVRKTLAALDCITLDAQTAFHVGLSGG